MSSGYLQEGRSASALAWAAGTSRQEGKCRLASSQEGRSAIAWTWAGNSRQDADCGARPTPRRGTIALAWVAGNPRHDRERRLANPMQRRRAIAQAGCMQALELAKIVTNDLSQGDYTQAGVVTRKFLPDKP